jgi:hypothetical protein
VTKGRLLVKRDGAGDSEAAAVEHYDGAVLTTPEGTRYRAADVTAIYDAHGRLDRVSWSEQGLPVVVPARWVVKLTRRRP